MLFILSHFSCGTTEKCTVSERKITNRAVFACNSQCDFVCEVFLYELHVKEKDFSTFGFDIILSDIILCLFNRGILRYT